MRVTLFSSLALIFAGALQTLSLSPFDYWVAALLSIALILLVTNALDPSSTLCPKRAALYGWSVGFGLFLSGASWVYVSINTYGHAPPPLAGTLTLLFVAALGLFHSLMFWLYAKIRSQSLLLNALLFAALWVANDGFRSVFLTGFPWLFIGDSQLHGPLHGWLPVIGSYGATYILALTAALLICLKYQRDKTTYTVIGSMLIFFWLSPKLLEGTEWTKQQDDEIKVALVQLNIPQELKWKRSQRPKTMQLLDEISAEHWDKDVIFWPETAVPIFYNEAKRHLRKFAKSASETDTTIVTGIPYRGWDKELKQPILHNSVTAIGDGTGLYHKQKLVPFGEYVPLQDILRGLIAFFDLPMSNFRKGGTEQQPLHVGEHKVAPFICYEVVYPDFVASLSTDADYLLTISNDSWFGRSIGPLQHLQLAQLRAAENGKYMVRATNNGVTAIIDQNGEITKQIPQFERGVLEGVVKTFKGSTPYAKLGSLPIFLLCSIIVLAAGLFRYKKGKP